MARIGESLESATPGITRVQAASHFLRFWAADGQADCAFTLCNRGTGSSKYGGNPLNPIEARVSHYGSHALIK